MNQVSVSNDKVSARWSQLEPVRDEDNFYMSPITRPYIIETAFGKENVEKYKDKSFFSEDYFSDVFLTGRRVKTILSLCCGFGAIERRYLKLLSGIDSCLGLDVADGAINVARARSIELGLAQIKYEKADLNNYDWPDNQYDLIVANGALHHLSNLETVCIGLRKSLRAGGVLVATEYVGPAYQDHSPRQLELINAASYLVPPELRARQAINLPFQDTAPVRLVRKLYSAGNKAENPDWPKWKKQVSRYLRRTLRVREDQFRFGPLHLSPKKHLLKVDPSECIRSDEIIPNLQGVFGSLKIFPIGGGLLQHALDEKFYKQYDLKNPRHAEALNNVCSLEKNLMAAGEIGIENAFLVAEKR